MVGKHDRITGWITRDQLTKLMCKEVVLFLGTYLDVSLNGGTQQPWVFLLKMIILGCFGGTTIFGNIHIYVELM